MTRTIFLSLLCWSLAAQSSQSGTSLSALLARYQTDTTNAQLCEQIGVAYAGVNDFARSAEFLRKALVLQPDSIPASKNLATVLWFSGKKSDSQHLFEELERKVPSDIVPQLYLGLGAYDANHMEVAADHFVRAGALASDNPEVLSVVVTSFLLTGRAENAVNILERRAKSEPPDAQIYRLLGEAFDRLNRIPEASRAYSQAVDIEPAVEQNYLASAAFSIEHGKIASALESLQQGLHRLPNSAKLTLEEGLVWAIQGNFDGARTAFRQAGSLDPRWSLPVLALGIIHLQTGNAPEAAEMFSEAKHIAPMDYRCYYFHALALKRSETSQTAGTRLQIMKELQHAVSLAPNLAQPRVALAQSELLEGQSAAAEQQLREAIRLDPHEPTALYKLALLLRKEGNKAEANRLFVTFESLKKNAQTEENEFALLSETVNDEGSRQH